MDMNEEWVGDGQGNEETELREACGVFGCVATGEWPTEVDIAHTIFLGLVALQHRYEYIHKDHWMNIDIY